MKSSERKLSNINVMRIPWDRIISLNEWPPISLDVMLIDFGDF
jgi:hypothetical protein